MERTGRAVSMFAAFLLASLLGFSLMCLADVGEAHAAVKVNAGQAAKATIYKDSKTQNSVTLKLGGAKASKAKWKSSKKKVATVSKKGKVTAKKNGKTTITAKVGKKTFKCVVTVKSVALNMKKASVEVGSTVSLQLVGDKIKKVVSKSPKVATIAKSGVIVGKSVGKTTVTITSKKGKKYKCAVTVTPATPKSDAGPKHSDATDSGSQGANAGNSGSAGNSKDSNKADSGKADSGKADSGKAGSSATDSGKTDSGKTDPGTEPGTDQPQDPIDDSVHVTGISFVQDALDFIKNDDAFEPPSIDILAKIEPPNATNRTITYKSSNDRVAEVSDDGRVTPVGLGTAEIVAISADGEFRANCRVIVGKRETPVTGVAFTDITDAPLVMHPYEVQSHSATVEPSNAEQTVVYSSDHPSIVDVDDGGVFRALAAGQAIVTARSVADKSLMAQCRVVVKPLAAEADVAVKTPEQLKQAIDSLASGEGGTKTLKIETDTKGEFDIGEDGQEFNDTTLVVDAPTAEVRNHAHFQSVIIERIAKDTYHEYAKNSIVVNAPSSHIVVEEAGSADIAVVQEGAETTIESNGQIAGLAVKVDSTVTINGANNADPVVPVTITANATVSTDTRLNVTARDGAGEAKLVLREGSQGTVVAADTASDIPDVEGIDSIRANIGTGNEEDSDTVVVKAKRNKSVIDESGKYVVRGSVSNMNGKPLPNADVSLKLYGASDGEEIARVRTNGDGAYSFGESSGGLEVGNYVIAVSLAGYPTVTQDVSVHKGSSQAVDGQNVVTVPPITLLEEAYSNARVELQGQVIDGALGGVSDDEDVDEGINEITVNVRAGADAFEGDALTTKTDGWGHFTIPDIVPGTYTVQLVDRSYKGNYREQYIETYQTVTVVVSGTADEGVFDMGRIGMTHAVDPNSVRFILSWCGETAWHNIVGADELDIEGPHDLDSHLTGPTESGDERFHTYFSDRYYPSREYEDDSDDEYSDNTGDEDEGLEAAATSEADSNDDDPATKAYLDRDDTNWSGPETTTILKKDEGVYTFFVHNYTHRGVSLFDDSQESVLMRKALSMSRATVQVYVGNTRRAVYNVPAGIEGTLWNVCTYDSKTNQLTAVNTMEFEYDPGSVGEYGSFDGEQSQLRVVSVETNELVKAALVQERQERITLYATAPITEESKGQVRVTTDPATGVTAEVVLDREYSDYDYHEDGCVCVGSILLSDSAGANRKYDLCVEYDYSDLRITGFKDDPALTSAHVTSGSARDRVTLSCKIMELASVKALVEKNAVIAKDGCSVSCKGEYLDELTIVISDGALNRSYSLEVDMDYGDLAIASIGSDSVISEASVSDVDIWLSSTSAYPATIENHIRNQVNYAAGECSATFVWHDYDIDEDHAAASGMLVISNTQGQERAYRLFVRSSLPQESLQVSSIETNEVITQAHVSDWGTVKLEVIDPDAATVDAAFKPLFADDNCDYDLRLANDASWGKLYVFPKGETVTADRCRSYWVNVEFDVDEAYKRLDLIGLERTGIVSRVDSVWGNEGSGDIFASVTNMDFSSYKQGDIIPIKSFDGAVCTVNLSPLNDEDNRPSIVVTYGNLKRTYILNLNYGYGDLSVPYDAFYNLSEDSVIERGWINESPEEGDSLELDVRPVGFQAVADDLLSIASRDGMTCKVVGDSFEDAKLVLTDVEVPALKHEYRLHATVNYGNLYCWGFSGDAVDRCDQYYENPDYRGDTPAYVIYLKDDAYAQGFDYWKDQLAPSCSLSAEDGLTSEIVKTDDGEVVLNLQCDSVVRSYKLDIEPSYGGMFLNNVWKAEKAEPIIRVELTEALRTYHVVSTADNFDAIKDYLTYELSAGDASDPDLGISIETRQDEHDPMMGTITLSKDQASRVYAVELEHVNAEDAYAILAVYANDGRVKVEDYTRDSAGNSTARATGSIENLPSDSTELSSYFYCWRGVGVSRVEWSLKEGSVVVTTIDDNDNVRSTCTILYTYDPSVGVQDEFGDEDERDSDASLETGDSEGGSSGDSLIAASIAA